MKAIMSPILKRMLNLGLSPRIGYTIFFEGKLYIIDEIKTLA